jgi:hypothetical protein
LKLRRAERIDFIPLFIDCTVKVFEHHHNRIRADIVMEFDGLEKGCVSSLLTSSSEKIMSFGIQRGRK